MEALYSKLYATYNEFKTNKFTDMEKLNRNQEEKFLAFTNAADELLQQYRIENERLVAENEDLRSELALTRSSMDDKIAEYQKLLMEENQKKNKLKREKTDSACISTISKLKKGKRFKGKEIIVGTLQRKKEKTYKDGYTCFFCKKSGHVQKKCLRLAAWRMKKGSHLEAIFRQR